MTAPSLDPAKRAALIFIPGISRSWSEGSLRKMADDVAVALNNNQTGASFTSAPAQLLQVTVSGDTRAVRRVSIERTAQSGGTVEAALDLYELEYVRGLAARQERQSLLLRAVMIVLTLFAGWRQLLAFLPFGRKGKTNRERFQLGLMLALLLLYAAFLGIIVASLIALATETLDAAIAARDAVGGAPVPTPSPPPPSPEASPVSSAGLAPVEALRSAATSFIGRLLQLISLVAALLWFVLPPRTKIKEAITNTATDYLGAQWYLSESIGANQIAGGLDVILNRITEAQEYDQIDIVSYSLGSIVAINHLFPAGAEPPAGHVVRSVDTLVTIGSPFDVIRLLLPDYFKSRRPAPNVPRRWLNVYAPDDILGSNFRNDDRQAPADPDVVQLMSAVQGGGQPVPAPENVPYLPGGVPSGGGPFAGMRIHGSYWGEGPGDETCWALIVPRIYGDHPLLAASVPAVPPAAPAAPSSAEPGRPGEA